MIKKVLLNSPASQGVTWVLFCLCLVIFSLGVSWKISTSINLNYGMWYDTLEINKTIDRYAVQNKFGKQSFVETTKSQHVSLFQKILISVTHEGIGLSDIRYKANNNQYVFLLTQDEVIHLKDVSILIDRLSLVWLFSFILLCIFCVYFRFMKTDFPSNKIKVLLVTGIGGSIFTLFFWYGFTPIFYYLHTVVFPDEHQWFFYYQDSLMSTLMKAPDLFEVIGIMLLTITLVVYYLISKLLRLINILPR